MNKILHTVVRSLLLCVALTAIAILAARAARGVFSLPGIHVVVNSPFVAEGALWLTILALLLLAREAVYDPQPVEEEIGFLAIPLIGVTIVVGVAFAFNLTDPFLSDDYIILSGPRFHWAAFLAALQRAGGDGSWRPLGTVYYQSLLAVAGANPVLWHLAGLALHLLNCGLVFAIAWRFWGDRTSATVAAFVFGLNGTRPEAALWTAGNCDLLACACVLGSIWLAIPAPTQPGKLRLAAALLLVAAGVLFKESAYAAPLIAGCLLWPYSRKFVVGASTVCAALFAWRWHLFHGPGGYIDPTTGRPAVLSLHALTAAKAIFIRVWSVLLVPVNWDAPSSRWLAPSIALSLLGLLWVFAPRRTNPAGTRQTSFRLIGATCCAVLPAIHLALIGQSEFGSRVLYLAGAPFALWIGCNALGSRKLSTLISAVMVIAMAGILENNLAAWRETAIRAEEICHTTRSGSPVPGMENGVPLFQNGFEQCVAAVQTTGIAPR